MGSRSAEKWAPLARSPGDLAAKGCHRQFSDCSRLSSPLGLGGRRDFLLLRFQNAGVCLPPAPGCPGGRSQNPLTHRKNDVLGCFRSRNQHPNTLTR